MKKLQNALGAIALSSTALVLSSTALAAPLTEKEERPQNEVILGLGALSQSTVFEDSDNQTQVIPLVFGDVGNFWFRGLSFGYQAFENDTVTVSPFIQLNFGEGFEADDIDRGSQLFAGLDEPDEAVEFGVAVDWTLGDFELGTSYRTDITNTHDGDIFSVSLSRPMIVPSWRAVVIPSVSVDWVSEDFNQYYYGVSPNAANAFRPAFEADDTINFDVSVTSIFQVGERWRFLARGAYSLNDSDLEDSPLVDNSNEWSVILGLGYTL